jgi:hypothetical protein
LAGSYVVELWNTIPELVDTWLGKLGATGVIVATLKAFLAIWNKQHPKPVTVAEVKRWQLPLFGWLGRRLAIESTAITQAIQIKTLRATNARLEQIIHDAGIESGLTKSDDSSLPKPELTPTILTGNELTPSDSTNTLPESPPLSPQTSG